MTTGTLVRAGHVISIYENVSDRPTVGIVVKDGAIARVGAGLAA